MSGSQPTPADAQATLAAWIAEQAEIRSRLDAGPGAGVADIEQVASMDGLSMMQAMLRGEGRAPSIGRTMDFGLISVEYGRAVFQGTPGPAHLNPMGGVHGGWYASVLDSALGCSVNTTLAAGRGYTTLELKLNMIRALNPNGQPVRAIGQTIHVGMQTATAEARLVGHDGRLCAHATTTCLIFALRRSDAVSAAPSHPPTPSQSAS
ncbi:MAG: PaaI family thioesterase [Rubrivivax sp.]